MSGLADVIPLDPRRRLPCPHCPNSPEFTIRDLERHIDDCPTLAARRAHPSAQIYDDGA